MWANSPVRLWVAASGCLIIHEVPTEGSEVKMALWPIFLVCYVAFIVIFMVIPASLGFSFGIRNLYLATLYKVFEVSLSIFAHRDVINCLLNALCSAPRLYKVFTFLNVAVPFITQPSVSPQVELTTTRNMLFDFLFT